MFFCLQQSANAITQADAITLIQQGQFSVVGTDSGSINSINNIGANDFTGVLAGVTAEVIAVNDEISLTSLDPSVGGNVLTNDSISQGTNITGVTTLNAFLVSSNGTLDKDAGNYGALKFDSTGAYTYLLYSSSPVVQNLSEGETLEDVFIYESYVPGLISSTATLTIRIVGSNNQTQFTARNDVNTITKNAGGGTNGSTIVSGNVSNNDVGGVSSYLIDATDSTTQRGSLISEFGSLTLDTTGAYTYTLFNDVEKIRALNFQESLTDTFNYQIVSALGNVAQATLTITILGAPGEVAGSIEVESNDTSSLATIINSTVAVNEPHYLKGHLTSSSDRDWYYIQSLGNNEIIHLDLCPPASSCYKENAWVMYVFDKSLLTSSQENSQTTLVTTGDKTGTVYAQGQSSHMYLNYEYGNYDASLIGIIDPCFGDRSSLDVGVSGIGKEYYVVISSPLRRTNAPSDTAPCGSGLVTLEEPGPTFTYNTGEVDATTGAPVTAEEASTRQFIAVEPNSEDQYTFSVIRTGINPVRSLSVDSARFDKQTRTLSIPKIRVNEDLYSASITETATKRNTGADTSAKFDISKLEKIDSYSLDSGVAQFDPNNNIVRVPKYLDEDTNEIYSLILLYHPGDESTNHWLEFIYADKVN